MCIGPKVGTLRLLGFHGWDIVLPCGTIGSVHIWDPGGLLCWPVVGNKWLSLLIIMFKARWLLIWIAKRSRGILPTKIECLANYTAGTPATILYIKNSAKDIVAEDFYYIFGSVFGSVDAAKSRLSVKLMQEGRMRGQAFVTFPSVEQSQYALNLVNGYVFKGKPMIIQFGRNPAAVRKLPWSLCSEIMKRMGEEFERYSMNQKWIRLRIHVRMVSGKTPASDWLYRKVLEN